MDIGIRPSANSLKKKGETSICFRIARLMNNQKNTEKEQLPKKKRKRRQECCGYCEKCITIGLRITRFRCTRFSRWKVLEKPDVESLGTNSKGTIYQVYATSCEYLGKERAIVGKINVKVPHQRSPYAQDSHLTVQPGASQGSPLRVAPGGPMGYGRGPHSFAACRDEKLTDVSDVKAFDEERTWVNRVPCEIVFQPVTDAP